MAKQTIILLPRVLKQGLRGNDVLAMKRALSMANYGRWKPFTKLFGPAYTTHVKNFQRDHGIKVDGVYGPSTHKALAKYFDAYGMKLMNDMAYEYRQENDPINQMVSAALEIYNYCRLTGRGQYTQTGRRMSIVRNKLKTPFPAKTFLYEDCSSSCTGISFIAKIPDPNGLGYDGEGYTGTMSVHGFRVPEPAIGAFGFFGWKWPYTHVVMCIARHPQTLVFSWGSDLPKILPANYRNDFNHWRMGYVK
jgi:peptidoglycan hydrolase-like protein with peptidoglycan-binding domain